MPFKRTLIASHLAILCAASAPALAQNAPPDAQKENANKETPANDINRTEKIETVTVAGIRQKATATKQDAELRDLPQSVTVISEQLIQERAYTRIEEIANSVPNLQPFTPYYGGISQGFFSRGFADTKILLDGYKAGAEGVYDLISIDRIEVLRGPASVLYGQGSPGGIVNLVTKRPLKTFGISAEASADSIGARSAEFDWNQPLSSTLGLRLIGSLEDSDSFRDFARTKRQFISPVMRWTPDADTTFDALYQVAIYRSPYDEGIPTSRQSSLPLRVTPIERSYLEPWAPLRRTTVESLRAEATRRVTPHWSLTAGYATTRNRVSDAVSSIQVQGYDVATNSVLRNVRGEYPSDQNRASDSTLSLRARGDVTFGGLQHQIVAGVERSRNYSLYNVYKTDIAPLDFNSPAYGNVPPTRAVDFAFAGGGGARTTAAYVNDLITLSPHWKFQLGLRRDRIVSEGYSDAAFTLSDKTGYTRNTPSVGVVWQPDARTSFYMSYTTSFVPQFGRNRFNDVLDPEIGKALELGFKRELLNGRLALTGAVFSIEKDGILQSDPADNSFQINGGKARSRGLEIELQGNPIPGTQLIAGVGVADAKWVTSNDFPVGERLPGPSRLTAVLSIRQALRASGLPAGAWVSAAANYGSSREWIAPADPYKLPAYTRLDLAAGLPLGAHAELQLNIKNATDARITSANGFGIVIPEPPRAFALSVRYRFGSL
jgi:iron complex outermembrane recepter protein